VQDSYRPIVSEQYAPQRNNRHRKVERIFGSIVNPPAERTRSVTAMRAVVSISAAFCAEQFASAPAC
jgi:hypothetical protein